MRRGGKTARARPVVTLALAALLLLNAGCLLAVCGAAAGGAAAAGYVYYKGLLSRDYPSNLGDSLAAVRTSLVELQFPVLKEKASTGETVVTTRTTDGTRVHIWLETVPSRIPVEGALTRISVRVGFTGDEVVSARILDQVSRHLVPPAMLPGPAPAPTAALPPAPPQTREPALAGPAAVAKPIVIPAAAKP
jgi:hypothetical protein